MILFQREKKNDRQLFIDFFIGVCVIQHKELLMNKIFTLVKFANEQLIEYFSQWWKSMIFINSLRKKNSDWFVKIIFLEILRKYSLK